MKGFGVNEIIRYIASDCGAVGIIHDEQGYAKSAEDAVADVLHAGILGPNPLFIFYKWKFQSSSRGERKK